MIQDLEITDTFVIKIYINPTFSTKLIYNMKKKAHHKLLHSLSVSSSSYVHCLAQLLSLSLMPSTTCWTTKQTVVA